MLAQSMDCGPREARASLQRLVSEHRITLVPNSDKIWMAHPFSGIETGYRSTVGTRTWNANCAWDALAILALLGDGTATLPDQLDTGQFTWTVSSSVVSPGGLVHMIVPARRFWHDVGFT